MNQRYVWPAVALALGSLTGVVMLAALGKDTGVIMTALGVVILPLLVALISGQVAAVKEQTDGQNSRLMALVEESHRMLAAAHVPASALAPPPGPAQSPAPGGGEPQAPAEGGG